MESAGTGCAAGGRVMNGAPGHMRLMGRDCSKPWLKASFCPCLIKQNDSAHPMQPELFVIIIIISIHNLVSKHRGGDIGIENVFSQHISCFVLIPAILCFCIRSLTMKSARNTYITK